MEEAVETTEETIEETIEEMPDKIWVPFDELKMYLQQLSGSMMNMVNSIEQSLTLIEQNATKNKGDSNEQN